MKNIWITERMRRFVKVKDQILRSWDNILLYFESRADWLDWFDIIDVYGDTTVQDFCCYVLWQDDSDGFKYWHTMTDDQLEAWILLRLKEADPT